LPPGIFSRSDAFFDVRLTGAPVHHLSSVEFRMSITNTPPATYDPTPVGAGGAGDDPADFMLVPQHPAYLVNRIEIQPNGSETDDTIHNYQLFQDMSLRMSAEEKAVMGFARGISTSGPQPHIRDNFTNQSSYDEDGYGIAPGETRDYYLPVKSMLDQSRMFLPGKSQDPRIRLYMPANPVCSDSADGVTMTLGGVDCIVSGNIYEDSVLADLRNHYRSIPTISRVLVHETQSQDIKSAQVGIPVSDVSLTVFNGAYPMFVLTLERTPAALEYEYDSNRTKIGYNDVPAAGDPYGNERNNWIPIAALTLTDSNGNPVWYNNIPGRYLKNIAGAKQFPNSFVLGEKNMYPLVFSTQIEDTVDTGANYGGIAMDTNFQLKVVPGQFKAVPDETVTLRINALRYALFTMSPEGKLKVTKL
jgi:hypothetical protein